ncbi:MAG TPA: hypothetical protein VGS02_03880 [Acidobacteriaceae bacterium]|nr:hypothetical protein [Acidobacteriaceae bacterium]
MRYSAFEQAAAEATSGMKEIETQIEQLMAQMDQLKGKRDLLDNLSQQLALLQPATQPATDSIAQFAPAARSSSNSTVAPAEMPAPRPVVASSPDVEAEMAAASARSLRDEWTGRSSSDSGVKGPSDSTIRGRL